MSRAPGAGREAGEAFPALRADAAKRCVPIAATWEITHRCPLDCRHCYLRGAREEAELDTREAKALLREMAREGILFLTFTGGEPLARADFVDVAAEAGRLGFAWRLFTAGTLVDGTVARELARLGPLAVDLSLHGLEETHDWMTRVPGSFREAAAAAERCRGLGIRVNVKMCITPRGLGDVAGLRRLAEGIGAGFKASTTVFPPHDGRAVDDELVLTDEELAGYFAEGERARPTSFGRRSRLRAGDFVCTAGRNGFSVSPGGDVRACFMLRRVCGNVPETSLADIWRSEGMAAARRIGPDARPACRDCEDEEFCSPCPGLAEKETGDALGAPPTACRQAEIRHGLFRRWGLDGRGGPPAPGREGCAEL